MPTDATGDDLDLMTADGVAALMKVSREYVYRLCAAGELESFVLQGQRARRIKRSSVAAFLARQPRSSEISA